MENVKELLKKEQQAKDILANIGREKEELAINKLTELKEILAALDCSHLLEAETIERIVEKAIIKKGKVVEVAKENNPVNITINKGKIVQGPVQVVQDMTEIEKHLNTIAEQGKEIERLREKLAEKEAAKITETTNVFNEDDYMEFLASQEESIMSELKHYEQQQPIVKEQVKKEVKEEKKTEKGEKKNIDAPQFVEVSNSKVGKNPNAKLYQTEKCYLIASPTTDEITWLSNEELSDAYKIAVENMLVAEHKFLTNRTKLSPVKINRNNGYMARSSAMKV